MIGCKHERGRSSFGFTAMRLRDVDNCLNDYQDVAVISQSCAATTLGVVTLGYPVADFLGLHEKLWRVGLPIYVTLSLYGCLSLFVRLMHPRAKPRGLVQRLFVTIVNILITWVGFAITVVLMRP